MHLGIPFICKQCGDCCRKLGIELSNYNITNISKHLELSLEEFINKYIGEVLDVKGDSIKYERKKPHQPCQFLDLDSKCSVYPVRPGACSAFPLFSDAGDRGIGCPGKKETDKAMSVIGRGQPYYTNEGRELSGPKDKLEKSYQKLKKAGFQQNYLDIFRELNKLE
ncbi:YkgJ family cysteine cluster protein [Candidatus Woesearchaeota archaeon]|nr:YkgJ family cysteine cluster protein [Candidatus Woesearchaeota archaeon]